MNYDIEYCIIGGGPAGLAAARIAARHIPSNILLIECSKLGGECTWTGCVPSKSLIQLAAKFKHAHELAQSGILQNPLLNSSKVMDAVRETVSTVAQTHTPASIEALGVQIIFGSPYFINEHTISVNGKIITCKTFLIATGSRCRIPLIKGLSQVEYLTNHNLFNLETLPKSLIVLGGGTQGVELAGALSLLGTNVTILESHHRIMPHDDHELAQNIHYNLELDGIKIYTNVCAHTVTKENLGVTVMCTDKEGQPLSFTAEKLLIASGRQPNIEGLNLPAAGVEVTNCGIVVDDYLRTTSKNIFAAGDVLGTYQFSHIAEYQAEIATRNALKTHRKAKVSYNDRIWVGFTNPECAALGLTQHEAEKLYKADTLVIHKSNFANLDRSRIDDIKTGMAKFICDKRGMILGAHIVGPRAGEIIHEIQLGKYFRMPLSVFSEPLYAYPTYSAIIQKAALNANASHKNRIHQIFKKILDYFLQSS